MCNKKRKPNQNTTRAQIVIARTPYVFWEKSHKNHFFLTLFLVFLIWNKKWRKKKMRVHVIPQDPFRSISQKSVLRGPQIYGHKKPCPNTILRQSFMDQACSPNPWLPFLIKSSFFSQVIGRKNLSCVCWIFKVSNGKSH